MDTRPRLVALVCNCAGSVPLVRRFLSTSHHPSPFSVPIYKGDEAKRLAQAYPDILAHISQYSSYAILLGTTSTPATQEYVWADINLRHSQQIKGKVIVETFAQY